MSKKSNSRPAEVDWLAAIRRTLATVLSDNSVAELRILGADREGTVSGYFDPDHHDAMATAAEIYSGEAEGVYFTLNPVRPELLARAANRTRAWAKHTTADIDIVARRWVPVDFDPVRPAGISSTSGEHNAAIERMQKCREWLQTQGIRRAATVAADSGNGAHLLIRVDLPNDVESRDLIKAFLTALDLQFSDSLVKVDLTTFNAARIFKVYGTMSCKGDSISDRPHRHAKVLRRPKTIVIAEKSSLQRVAALVPPKPVLQIERAPAGSNSSTFDVADWIARHNLPVVSEKPWRDGRIWLLNPCPWDESHTNTAAFITQGGNGAIGAGCHHNGCAGRGWHELRDLVEPGWRVRRLHEPGLTSPPDVSPAIARCYQQINNRPRRRK